MTKSIVCVAGASVLAAGLSVQVSFADGTEPLGEIIVTAQKRSESLETVPISITALTANTLESANVVTVSDLTALTPGLQAQRTAGVFSTPYIRGVGSNSSLVGDDSSVATYLDGVYLSSKYGNLFDLYNIERVEVLKGPQGTLFGRNATGGAINVVTKDPSDQPEAKIEGTYGNYDMSSVKAYAAGPLTDILGASVSVLHQNGGGFVHSIYGGALQGGNKDNSIMAKFVLKPNDQLRLVATADYSDSADAEGLAGGFVPGSVPLAKFLGGATAFGVDVSSAGTGPQNDVINKGVSLHLTYDMPWANFVSISAYRTVSASVIYDEDGSNANIFLFHDDETDKTFSQEFQLLSNGSGPLKWMVGADYADDRPAYAPLSLFVGMPYPPTVASVQAATFASPNNALIDIDATARDKAEAVFGQSTYDIAAATRVTVGLRYTREEKYFTGNESALVPNGLLLTPPNPAESNSLTPVPIVATAPGTSVTYSKPTWRFSLDHDFAEGIMGYLSFNRGFKSGAYNTTSVAAHPAPVSPEVLDAYELGVKSELLDRRLRLNGAIFHYSWKNLQVERVNASTGVVTLENAAQAKSDGIELEADASLTQALTMHVGLAGLHSEYENFTDAAVNVPCNIYPTTPGCVVPAGNGQGFINASGQTQIFAPKFTGNLSLDYRTPFIDGTSLVLSAQYYHNSGYDSEVGGRLNISSYDTLGVSGSVFSPGEKYFVKVWGKNITDAHIVAYTDASGEGDRFDYYRPATYGITLGAKF